MAWLRHRCALLPARNPPPEVLPPNPLSRLSRVSSLGTLDPVFFLRRVGTNFFGLDPTHEQV